MILAALVAVGCDHEADVQLVRGRVAQRVSAMTVELGLTARTEGRLVARTPVEEGGAFIVALPVGGPYRIELDAQGNLPIAITRTRDQIPLLLEVCSPGPLVDTGTISIELSCLASPECIDARDALAACRSLHQTDCFDEEQTAHMECDGPPGPGGPCEHPIPVGHLRTTIPTSIGCAGGAA